MYTLSNEQANTLIQLIIEQCGSTSINRLAFTELAHSHFENIPGFETIQLNQADELINQLWGMYMSKKEASATEGAVKPNTSKVTVSAVVPVDLSKPTIKKAIDDGKVLIAEGKTKADAARAMYPQISTESKETIVAAFVEGATLTPKGAQTYWYNCRRKASKEKKTTQ